MNKKTPKINQINKEGFRTGTWHTFFINDKNGNGSLLIRSYDNGTNEGELLIIKGKGELLIIKGKYNRFTLKPGTHIF